MRKGLKRKTYQNLPSLICVEFCPYLGSNHRHHDLKESALRPRPNSLHVGILKLPKLPHSQQIFGLNGRNRQKSLVQNIKKLQDARAGHGLIRRGIRAIFFKLILNMSQICGRKPFLKICSRFFFITSFPCTITFRYSPYPYLKCLLNLFGAENVFLHRLHSVFCLTFVT